MTIVNWCHAASVKLRQLERNVSRNDIECPGDMILFNCSVQSNSENVQLTWEVTFPDQTTLNITYYNHSGITVHDLGLGSSTSLTEYIEDHYIESTITFTVIQTVQLNGSQLECRSSDLDSETLDVPVNTSGELANDDWEHVQCSPPPPPPSAVIVLLKFGPSSVVRWATSQLAPSEGVRYINGCQLRHPVQGEPGCAGSASGSWPCTCRRCR